MSYDEKVEDMYKRTKINCVGLLDGDFIVEYKSGKTLIFSCRFASLPKTVKSFVRYAKEEYLNPYNKEITMYK